MKMIRSINRISMELTPKTQLKMELMMINPRIEF